MSSFKTNIRHFQHKILIVEDTKDCLINLIRAIESLRHIPVPVLVGSDTTIENIVEVARVHSVHAALLDNRLIRFTGEDVARKLPKGIRIISTSSAPGEVKYTGLHVSGKDICLRFESLASQIEKHLNLPEPLYAIPLAS